MDGDSDDNVDAPVIAPRRKKRINRGTKLQVSFDENARKEFLTGFRKRKLQRKKAAEEEFQRKLKEERKRIKMEAREEYKKMVQTYKPIPELEEMLAKEYKVKDSTVSVLELDTDLLAETNFIIGRNRGSQVPIKVKKEGAESEDEMKEEDESDDDNLPGMELSTKKEVKKKVKDVAAKEVKKSKIFQKKNKMEKQKQWKKMMRIQNEKKKVKAKRKSKSKHRKSNFKKKG